MARRAAIPAALILSAVVAGWSAWRFSGEGSSSPNTAATSADFIGAAVCATCHATEHAAWKGSHHDLAMQEARPGAVLGNFKDARFTYGSVTSTFFQRDGRYFVRTDAADGRLEDFEVKYTYGVEPLQQYLVELTNGRIQPLPIAWDSRPAVEGGQRWFHLYPAESITHSDDLHWTGIAQNWNFMCADCHSTRVRKGYDAGTGRFTTTWSEINVACEACHGPASRHVKWAEASPLRRSLFWKDNGLSSPLTGPRGRTDVTLEVCAQCHSRRSQIAEGYVAGAPLHDYYIPSLLRADLYYADGQQRDEVYVYGSFLQSRMHQAGVTCSDCHDPHSQKLRAPAAQLCIQCHKPESYDVPSHHFHAAGSAGAQCVSCHMPETTYMVVDARRDHRFGVPRPDQTVELGVPSACNACHKDRGAQWAAESVKKWSGRNASGFQTFAATFRAADVDPQSAAAELRQVVEDMSQPALVRASALDRLRASQGAAPLAAARLALSDQDPLLRHTALQVLEALDGQDRVGLAAPKLTDPSRAVRIRAAWLLAPAASLLSGPDQRTAFERAASEFIESQRYNADRPESRVALGAFFARLGRLPEAQAEYRAALQLSPRLVAAYVNLADLYRQQQMEADAERTIRDGIGVLPDDPALYHALGLSLARSRRVAEAIAALERAARLAPDQPQWTYAYAVALHSGGRGPEAIQVIEKARVHHPRNRNLLFALATFYRDDGKTEAAIQVARRLADIFPEDREAQALLQSLR